MTKLRNALVAVMLVQTGAFAAGQDLLGMVMPDAKVVAGVRVDASRNSLFGQYVLSHMQIEDENFKKFFADTGFDPRRDVTEIVMASNWSGDASARWLVLARGAFNSARITAAVQANGGNVVSFSGIDLLGSSVPPRTGQNPVVAFLDQTNAAMGDPDSVKAAIQRFQKGEKAAIIESNKKIQDLMSSNDFWFYSMVPVSEFAGAMPDPNLSQAMQGNLLQAITQVSGGLKFGAMVRLSAEAVTRSDKDAGALVDVVRFVAGMIQLNKEKSGTASDVSSLVDTMDLKTNGNVMTVSLLIPETQLEKILNSAKSERKQTAHK